jgi:hypothetical protein
MTDRTLKLFVPLFKADASRREVHGVAAVEEIDHTGEIFDYKTSKPHFVKWSQRLYATTGGKSFGNLRGMHDKIAAGKLTQIDFDDTAKAISIVAKVVDNDEWQKVEEGVYTGFSIGGKYEKQWRDGASMRYTAVPSEISLVDLPCMPSATYTMVKLGGAKELRKRIGAAIYLGKNQWARRDKLTRSALHRYNTTGDLAQLRADAVWHGAIVESHAPPVLNKNRLACTTDESVTGVLNDALREAVWLKQLGFHREGSRCLEKAVRLICKGDSLAALHNSEKERADCAACRGYDYGPQPRRMAAEHERIRVGHTAGYHADELNDLQHATEEWRRNALIIGTLNDALPMAAGVPLPAPDVNLLPKHPTIPATMSGGERRRPGDYF